jgi:hypothetical protein
MISDLNMNHKNNDLIVNNNSDDTDEKKLLDIYYYIDYDDNLYDINIIERCLQLNLQVNERSYQINRFINCKKESIMIKNDDGDVIRRGLLTFNKMFRRLKLKGNTDVWFIYLSNGNVKVYEDVFVGLLNKNPCIKTTSYVINKSSIHISKTETRTDKLEKLKVLNKSLKDLVTNTDQNKMITYTNLLD